MIMPIDPDKERWELCWRVLSRRDVIDRFSMPSSWAKRS